MKTRFLAAVLAATAIIGAVAVAAGPNLKDVKCLMADKPANAEKAATYKDGKVFFCCDGCKGKFEKASKEEIAKMAHKANHQLVASKQYEQQACPMSGGKVDASTAIEVAGAKIAFCCNNCKGTAEKMKPEEQVEKLFGEEAFTKAKFAVVKEKK